jgi:hypothetical protein
MELSLSVSLKTLTAVSLKISNGIKNFDSIFLTRTSLEVLVSASACVPSQVRNLIRNLFLLLMETFHCLIIEEDYVLEK